MAISGRCFTLKQLITNQGLSYEVVETSEEQQHVVSYLLLQGAAPLLQQIHVLHRGAGLVCLDLLVRPLQNKGRALALASGAQSPETARREAA